MSRTPSPHPIEITCSRGFLEWLAEEQISLAFTTYQTNRLFLLGRKQNGELSTFERLFDRPMGLFAQADRLYLGCRYQLWQMDNALPPGESHEEYDALYIPRRSYTTGDVDVHDLRVDAQGRLIFVNTLYSCLATVSERYSFRPLWQPPFISRLAPEDRCHLNGLALDDGRPRYVTAVSRADTFSGWRKRRESGGLLMDIESNQIVLDNLSMPHSPRLHGGKLWLLNAGSGDLGYVEREQGRFQPVAFCPGFARGLAFHKHYAIVGLSKPRRVRAFAGLSLDERLAAADSEAICGLVVIDTRTGNVAHWVEVEGIVTELFDVAVLPGVMRPMALGFKSDEISRFVTIDYPDAPPLFQPLSPSAESLPVPPIDFLSMQEQPAPSRPQPVRPSQPVRPAQPVAAYRFQHSSDMSIAAVEQSFGHLTFPPLREQRRGRAFREPLSATLASLNGEAVGLALAELHPDGESASLRSCFVSADHRRRGLGMQLIASLGSGLARQGLKNLEFSYSTDWPSAPVVEHILNRQGWSPPRPTLYQYKVNMADLSGAPWLEDERSLLPPRFEVVAWQDISPAQRMRIQQKGAGGWYPPNLSPFQADEYLAFNSLGLSVQGEIVGWMITHLPAPESVQYTSLFVDPEQREAGVGLALLATALNLQLVSEIPYAIWQVEAGYRGMLAFVKRYLAAYISKQSERRAAAKGLF